MTEESKDYIELNSKILAKNLEITKLTIQLDRCAADVLDAREKINDLHPAWMITVINKALTVIDHSDDLNDDDKFDLLNKLTKVGKHLSVNGSIQNHINDK